MRVEGAVQWGPYVIQDWHSRTCIEGQAILDFNECGRAMTMYEAQCSRDATPSGFQRQSSVQLPPGCHVQMHPPPRNSLEFQFNINADGTGMQDHHPVCRQNSVTSVRVCEDDVGAGVPQTDGDEAAAAGSIIFTIIWWTCICGGSASCCVNFGYAHVARHKMLQQAHAGQPVAPPSGCWRYCCGACAIYYWEGCSGNYWITYCLWAWCTSTAVVDTLLSGLRWDSRCWHSQSLIRIISCSSSLQLHSLSKPWQSTATSHKSTWSLPL